MNETSFCGVQEATPASFTTDFGYSKDTPDNKEE